MSTSGLYTVDYRVLIVTRTGCVFIMHGEFCRPLTQLSSHAVGLIQINNSFVTANMDNTLQCFTSKVAMNCNILPFTLKITTIYTEVQ